MSIDDIKGQKVRRESAFARFRATVDILRRRGRLEGLLANRSSFGDGSEAPSRLRRGIRRMACRAVAHAAALESRERRMVNQTGASWNEMLAWLHSVDSLRSTA